MENELSQDRLKSFVSRISKLEEDKAAVAEDVRDVYAEAKSAGFEPKIIRGIVKLLKMEAEKRREEEELMELYKAAVGLD